MDIKQMVAFLIPILVTVFLRPSLVTALEPGSAPAATDEELFKCDFEKDLCGMQITASPLTKFTWVRLAGSTPSENTGPDYDHTTGTNTGYYVYTEATEHQPGEATKLTIPSSSVKTSSSGLPDACLTLWTNMYGQHIGTLNVTLGQTDVIQWSLSYNQSYGWTQQNVTLKNFFGFSSNPSDKVISFVGVRGGTEIGQPFGDIAIDDVILYAGRCGNEETTTVEATTQTTTTVITTTEQPTTTATTLPTSIATTTATTTTVGTTTTLSTITTELPTTPPATTVSTTLPTTTTVTTTKLSTTSPLSTTVATTTAPLSTPTTATTTKLSTTTMSSPTTSSPSTIPTSTTTNVILSTLLSGSATSTMNSATNGNTASETSQMTTGEDISRDMTSTYFSMTSSEAASSSADNSNGLGSTPVAAGQVGRSTDERIWGLNERDMIILLAFLCAGILLLIIIVIVLACWLCITRRKYIVERSANMYPSSSSIDRVSTIEAQQAASRNYADKHVSPYDRAPERHF